jgi:hypothetical protein
MQCKLKYHKSDQDILVYINCVSPISELPFELSSFLSWF